MFEKRTDAPVTCPICRGKMEKRAAAWTSYCRTCDYWGAGLKYDIESEHDEIFTGKDESAISFLDALRTENFKRLLASVEALMPGRPLSILDVGCAAGLFLQIAQSRGHTVLGLEPNPKMAAAAKCRGLNVLQGYFPDALSADTRFDVITFNDVFEHIPELDGILTAARERLSTRGVLILNLPNSKGLLFQIGQAVYRFGVTNPWDRLWQTMFYTPHLHYFSSQSLDKLVGRFGFVPARRTIELPIMTVNGLWARVQADRETAWPKRVVNYVAALVMYPVLRFFPQDAFAAFYRPS